MFHLYKFFYVFFLQYSKNKNQVPWHGAFSILLVCFMMLIISLTVITGIFYPLMESFKDFGVHPKIILLIFVILKVLFLGSILHFILFKKLKISKENGLTPLYNFEPTKKDKIIQGIVALIFIASPFLLKGIEMYMDGKLFI